MKGPPPLRIELARSRLAIVFISITYIASAALLAFVPGSILLRGLAVIAIGAYALWTLRNGALRTLPRSVAAFEIAADGSAVLIDREGKQHSGRVQASSYVGTRFLTMVIRLDGARWSHALAVLPDMITADEMRRLRVMLRIVGSLGRRPTEDTS